SLIAFGWIRLSIRAIRVAPSTPSLPGATRRLTTGDGPPDWNQGARVLVVQIRGAIRSECRQLRVLGAAVVHHPEPRIGQIRFVGDEARVHVVPRRVAHEDDRAFVGNLCRALPEVE